MKDSYSNLDILSVIIRKGRIIIIVGLIFAFIIGGFKGTMAFIKSHTETETLEEYERELRNLEKTIERTQQSKIDEEDYIEQSIRMKFDPYNEYMTSVYISVTNIEEAAYKMVFDVEETPVSYLTNKILNQYIVLWSSFDLQTELGMKEYENIHDKYIRELISLTVQDGDLLLVRTYGMNAEDSIKLSDAAVSLIMAQNAKVSESSYKHSLDKVNEVTKAIIDTGLQSTQEDHFDKVDRYVDTISVAYERIDELEIPDNTLIAFVKYFIIGGVLGAIGACVFVFIKEIFGITLASAEHLKAATEANMLGSLSKKGKLFDRIADSMTGEMKWDSETKALRAIVQNAKLYLAGKKNILLVSTLKGKENQENGEKISEALTEAGFAVLFMGDVTQEADTARLVDACDGIVVIEKVGTSKVKELNGIWEMSKAADKKIDGFILV